MRVATPCAVGRLLAAQRRTRVAAVSSVRVFACAAPPGRKGRDTPPASSSLLQRWWGLRAARGDDRTPLYAGGHSGQELGPRQRAGGGNARQGLGHGAALRSFVAAAAAVAPAAVAAEAVKGGGRRTALHLESAVHYLPHPDKRATGGEDASFVGADGLSVGVADGVGGWADQGVDAGIYARLLMKNCLENAEATTAAQSAALASEAPGAPATPDRGEGDDSEEDKPSRADVVAPLNVMVAAHAATRVQGSSTALVLLLRKSMLHGANLGDSGFMILRGGRVWFKSEPQQHSFNFPYQIGSEMSDSPNAAQLYALTVQPGDVIVSGTDGLWDNLHDAEVAALVKAELSAGNGPEGAARRVAVAAHIRGADPRADTPFSRGARAARVNFRGGKMDDCTVVVSIVQQTTVEAA